MIFTILGTVWRILTVLGRVTILRMVTIIGMVTILEMVAVLGIFTILRDCYLRLRELRIHSVVKKMRNLKSVSLFVFLLPSRSVSCLRR